MRTSCFSFVALCVAISAANSKVLYGIRFSNDDGDKLTDPTVEIKQGVLRGKSELSRNGREFASFKGIRYGKVPGRFKNAEPAEGGSWKATRNAKEFGPPCSQVHILTKVYSGQEDCLTLNVNVPKTESNATLPVMFYIYGGAFVMGASDSYQGHYFMDEDIILVTINYRVGAFGFLNAGIKGASGNQALKDVVLGLKWVRDNVEAFGGDPSKVTIFGVSAGSAVVAHLVGSPMARGLFSGAISQSAVATIGWSYFPDPEFNEPKKLAHAVDCPTSNFEFMVECLRKVNPEVLARATDFKDHVWFERSRTPVFAPSIETYRESENDTNVFLSENLETIMDEGRFNQVPYMMGFVSHEGLSLHAAPILLSASNTKKINEQWGRVAPEAFFYWSFAKDPCRVSTKLKNAYFPENKIGLENADKLRQLYSDIGFEYPVRKIGLKHAKFAPAYFYNFTRHVKVSYVDLFGWKHANPASKTPTHGDDIQFLFSGHRIWPQVTTDSPDYEFSTHHVKLWASFAKTGKPSHFWGSRVNKVEPVNVTATHHNWLQIDNELSIAPESEDFLQRMGVLDEICKNDMEMCA